ncbi:isoleucyl-tRNA synthetase [Perkinsela sp. CCAP 1560/4]|nr:isoleucyl-tRNA synthetase [Perkinsela sp. CCAP 1560/4]|eukprot:KNH05265.1 isoleucyl-tRNA synthetase [Perkinsela sp. CCAP 1560/4]
MEAKSQQCAKDLINAQNIRSILHNTQGFHETKTNDKYFLSLPEVPESLSFPTLEHEVLNHWKDLKAFNLHLDMRKQQQNRRTEMLAHNEKKLTSIIQNCESGLLPTLSPDVKERLLWTMETLRVKLTTLRGSNNYVFYEGPPFATGLPHYGHLLAATIKDAVCRYYSNTPLRYQVLSNTTGKSECPDSALEEGIKGLMETTSPCKDVAADLQEIFVALGCLPGGFHVERVAGWDCHGLPIEFEIEKDLGIKTKGEVEKFGIGNYNEHCRAIVLRYKAEWKKVIERIGRWLDFDEEKEYKTMSLDYMESVWYIFHKLYEKNLVYRGFKVMPFSIGCGTPLSNFEANLNYKDINDASILVGFPIIKASRSFPENTMLVAWTTTLWTLPANFALMVNPEMTYVVVECKKGSALSHFVLAECRYEFFLGMVKQKKHTNDEAPEWSVVCKFPGSELEGTHYRPPFPFCQSAMSQFFPGGSEAGSQLKTGFVVLCDSFVSSSAGTGVVHCAPCFGEDDYRVCTENGLISMGDSQSAEISSKILSYLCPVDENGYFADGIGDPRLVGKFIKGKDAEEVLLEHIKSNKSLLAKGTIVHSYPFCWRSEVPLIYKAVTSWFVNINALRERMVKLVTEKTRWVPNYVCEKRFVNWIKGSSTDDSDNMESKSSKGKDWAISRSRFWGTPLPIWMSEDAKSVVVIRSVAELKEKAFVQRKHVGGGVSGDGGEELVSLQEIPVDDLHRHHIDNYVVFDPRGREHPPLKRISDVFDCWFESGCMPYAHRHYPFSYDKDKLNEQFSAHFPANFIAEGLDQTRGWFYTLLVLGTACFDDVPFKNVIVNGLVLAGDGRKMSKKLKNYPDPGEVIESYGADPLRMYFLSSGAVRGEPTKFNVDGVREMVKDIFIPLTSTLKFFVQNVNRYLRSATADREGAEKMHSLEVLRAYYFAVSSTDGNIPSNNSNIMDQWILSETQTLMTEFHTAMAKYQLFVVPGKLLAFLHLLTNFYVRMNRGRMKGRDGVQDQLYSLMSLLHVIYNVVMLISSFAPFFAEFAYATIRPLLPDNLKERSVHLCVLPSPNTLLKQPALEATFLNMRTVIEGIRTLRDQQKIPLKTPLKSAIIAHPSNGVCQDLLREEMVRYMTEEINVLYVESANVYSLCSVELQPNLPVLGKKFKKSLKEVIRELKSLSQETMLDWLRRVDSNEGSRLLHLENIGVDLECSDVNVLNKFNEEISEASFTAAHGGSKGDFKCISAGSFTLFLNTKRENDEELQQVTISRYFVSQVQQLRKKHNFHPCDEITIHYQVLSGREEFQEGAEEKMTNLSMSESASVEKEPLAHRTQWIEICLRKGQSDMERKLNARIIQDSKGNEKMSEILPFLEKGIYLKVTFY